MLASRVTRPASRLFGLLVLLGFTSLGAACGGRTTPEIPESFAVEEGELSERCNRLDDDGDGQVDEGLVDEEGRYVDDDHCGRCGVRCDQPIDHATGSACMLIGDSAICGATGCDEGYQVTRGGRCAPSDDFMCLPCLRDQDCGPLAGASCSDIGGENRCTRDCFDGCPRDYTCVGDRCEPDTGSCRCPADTEMSFTFACEVRPGCIGSAECRAGETSECVAGQELCGDGDDDCDGTVDEGFVDERGAYSLDVRHCGACGRDCTLDEGEALPLACGGDPFAPSCIIACPDAADGIQVGDMLDADRDIDNGCECRVRSLVDTIGSSVGDDVIDDNCDGADGRVLSSYYVATTGDDLAPGSPTRPLATINEAIRRAFDSRGTTGERLDVFVAGGVYVETVHILDGVRVHGGYRADYLKRDIGGYEVIVVAGEAGGPGEPSGGPALVARDVGFAPTLVEGLELRGRDATKPGEAAIGAVLIRAGDQLTLRDLRIRAGRPGAGASGGDGAAGADPISIAADGHPPRASIEDSARECSSSVDNRVFGGIGGQNICNGVTVSGGNGGTAVCPDYEAMASAGTQGLGLGGAGGPGGPGGVDLRGPIESGDSCPSAVCCGLADFSVPGTSFLATPGSPGGDGADGSAGAACMSPAGTFTSDGAWLASGAQRGTAGGPGGGGGGGGAGGGAEIKWFDDLCEFSDGLGGGGGGGGAGGCGGSAGEAGQSGGPSVAVLVRLGAQTKLPVIENCLLFTEGGGDGGDGGNGGDGGLGGSGAFGGKLESAERVTPSLAGPSGGERGGKGGDGGPGGGGGGGCGGNTVGIWIAGTGGMSLDPTPLAGGNVFDLGAPGDSGIGGGGPIPASDGTAGQSLAVLIQ
jgi:hypothetical protein